MTRGQRPRSIWLRIPESVRAGTICLVCAARHFEQVQCASARVMKKYKADSKTRQTLASANGSVVNGASPNTSFPAIGFKMPNAIPTCLTNWVTPTLNMHSLVSASTVYRIVIFTRSNFYYMTLTAISFTGPSLTQQKTDFLDMIKHSIQETCDCMEPAITKDFSKLDLFDSEIVWL